MPDLTGWIKGEKMGLFGKKKADFVSPAGGRLMNITEVEDPVFSSKMLGDGFAVDLTDGEIGAPFDGEVTAAFPTGHAFGLKRKDGLECLIHVGMDTVKLGGKHFTCHIEDGQQVKKGQLLLEFDIEKITAAGYSIITPVIISNTDSYLDVVPTDAKFVEVGDSIITIL